jgi:hypothetical protein
MGDRSSLDMRRWWPDVQLGRGGRKQQRNHKTEHCSDAYANRNTSFNFSQPRKYSSHV